MVAKTTNPALCALGVLLLVAAPVGAQNEVRETFFKEVEAAKAAADAADAALLAPRSYERGMKEYRDAELALERGRNIDVIRTNTSDATGHFRTATEAAGLAATTLAQVMKSRQDAANALAPELSAEIWQEAQRKFGEAIRILERGDLKLAQRRGIEATALYRDAELFAKQLLADAERELNETRYDTALPRSLAKRANYEAKHAIYLAEIVGRERDRNVTVEEIVLEWEKPLTAIAGAADVVPDMQDGPERLTAELVAYVDTLRADVQRLEQEQSENEIRLADMEEELRVLDERLGGATAERAALIQRLEAQARVKEQFERVEKMFTPEEARVFRQGNSVILRLVGLAFDSGESKLDPANFDLLGKVEKAIDVFPRSELTIEGHTDSFGGDDFNQKLSQERAESVQQYMINAMRIPGYRLIATGYGETRPVASNETASGREKNRRIDVVIKPNLEPS